MTTVASPTWKNPTGKNNLLTSLNKWMQTNITPANAADFTYFFTAQINPTVFPAVTVDEFPFFDPPFNAFGNVLYPSASYTSSQGRLNHAMIDINIYTSVAADSSAKKHLIQIRDRIVAGLTQAGLGDDVTGTQILPPIEVLDYDNGGADTGIAARISIEESNNPIERYYPPSADTPDIHRYQLLFKIQWFEMFS